MEKVIKIVVAVFVLVILVVLGKKAMQPKDNLSFEEDVIIRESLRELNNDLPRPIGTIGTLNSITYHKSNNRSISYNMTVFGDPSIKEFYQTHYQDFHDVFLYSYATLNGQNENATKFAEFLKEKGIGLSTTIVFPDKESMTWDFSPSEPIGFVNSYNGTPTEALRTVLDFHIALVNYNCLSITSNSIDELSEDGMVLLSIDHNDNTIIWNWGVDENQYDIQAMSALFQEEGCAEMLIAEMIQDPDVQELMNLISIAHSDISICYKGLSSNSMAEIVIPYSLIKRYSQVPNLHM